MYRQDPMEVLINAKGISADETTWKGAAILSCLGSAQELWINPKEFLMEKSWFAQMLRKSMHFRQIIIYS